MTNIDRVAGVYVSNPGGTLVASAGNDVNVIGAIIANTGKDSRTLVNAGHDINLGTVTEARNSRCSSSAQLPPEASARKSAARSWAVEASRSRRPTTSMPGPPALPAEGTLAVIADHDVNITEGRATRSTASASHRREEVHLLQEQLDVHRLRGQQHFGGQQLQRRQHGHLAPATTSLSRGSRVVAQDQLSLSAGRDVRIESSQDQGAGSSYSASSKKGYSASWANGTQLRQRLPTTGSKPAPAPRRSAARSAAAT